MYALILAGGVGTRLWPLSRKNLPKQMLPLMGEKTMVQATVDRILPITSIEHIFFATVEGSIHSHKIVVHVLDKKITPVEIDILLGPSNSSTTINPYALGGSFEYYEHTLQLYKMKATVYEPV